MTSGETFLTAVTAQKEGEGARKTCDAVECQEWLHGIIGGVRISEELARLLSSGCDFLSAARIEFASMDPLEPHRNDVAAFER